MMSIARRFRLHKSTSIIDAALIVLLLIISFCTNAGYLSGFIPQLDLLIHFQLQYLIALILVATCILIRKKFRLLMLSIILIAIPMSRVVPWYLGSNDTATSSNLKIFSANVKANNYNYHSFIELVNACNPDILIVIEATSIWQIQLKKLIDSFPYLLAHESDGAAGIMLFSKYPMLNKSVHVHSSRMATLTAEISRQQGNFSIAAVHPIRPGIRHGSCLRDRDLLEISKVLSTINGRLIVIGDLNTTMWSKGYTKFVKSNNLLNASKGNGIILTWGKYLKSLLSIPIDHCFTRGDFNVHSLHAVEISGSNHDGLVLEVHER